MMVWWKFNMKAVRNNAIGKVIDGKPLVLMTSAMCTDWSIARNADSYRLTSEEKRLRMMNAKPHLDFVCKPHAIQHNAGR